MLTYGSQVNPSLGRVDYSPLLQGAMARAQGTQQAGQAYGQAFASLGKGIASGIDEYQKRKMANDILESENRSMLRIYGKAPELKEFGPENIDKYLAKVESGGLSEAENRKIHSELSSGIKVGSQLIGMRQQQIYANAQKAVTERTLAENAELNRKIKASQDFRTFLNQNPNVEDAKLYQFASGLGLPADELNAYMSGRFNAGMYAVQGEVAKANLRGQQLANDEAIRRAEVLKKQAGENYQSTNVVRDPNTGQPVAYSVVTVDKITGRPDSQIVKIPEHKPLPGERAMALFGQFADAQRRGDKAGMLETAVTYGKEANYSGFSPGALVNVMTEELAKNPVLGGTGRVTTSSGLSVTGRSIPVNSEQSSPGAAPAPTGAATNAVVTPSNRVVATETMPPQPAAPSTPPAPAVEPAGFEAYNPTVEQQRLEAGYPTQDELVRALAVSAPPPPLVDTNIVPAPAPARGQPTSGYDYPIYSVLGIAERLSAESARKRAEIQAQDQMLSSGAGRGLSQIPETLLRAGEAGIAGVMTGDYSMPEKSGVRRLGEAAGEAVSGSMASEIKRLQREDEVLRSRPNSIEAYDIRRSRGLPGPAREGAGYTRSFTAEEMDGMRAGQAPVGRDEAESQIRPNVSRGLMEIISPRPSQRVKTEKLTKEVAKAEEAVRQPEGGVGLGLEVLPQINLSKDTKRIADLLLKEYESNKKGQPSFTITANQGGGKERAIKVSNPAILAVLSNPAMFERLIREGAAFSEASTDPLATRTLINERMSRMAREAEMLRQLEVMGRRPARGR
jgi:hypothetical protein